MTTAIARSEAVQGAMGEIGKAGRVFVTSGSGGGRGGAVSVNEEDNVATNKVAGVRLGQSTH